MIDKKTINQFRIIQLYRTNYLAKYHVREIAKLVHKSHVTLLPHLKALENNKIIIPTTLGKNKIYSLNLDNNLTKNYLIISEILDSIQYQEQVFLLKRITTEISKLHLPGSLVLFGSYAKQTFDEESDIDLFYIGKISEGKRQKIIGIGTTYGKTIHLKSSNIDAFDAGLLLKNPLLIEVIKTHILLQNAEGFCNILWRHYANIR